MTYALTKGEIDILLTVGSTKVARATYDWGAGYSVQTQQGTSNLVEFLIRQPFPIGDERLAKKILEMIQVTTGDAQWSLWKALAQFKLSAEAQLEVLEIAIGSAKGASDCGSDCKDLRVKGALQVLARQTLHPIELVDPNGRKVPFQRLLTQIDPVVFGNKNFKDISGLLKGVFTELNYLTTFYNADRNSVLYRGMPRHDAEAAQHNLSLWWAGDQPGQQGLKPAEQAEQRFGGAQGTACSSSMQPALKKLD